MFDYSDFERPSGDVMSVSKYVQGALSLVIDERTTIDFGGGFGARDLWLKIDGKEFLVTIKESSNN